MTIPNTAISLACLISSVLLFTPAVCTGTVFNETGLAICDSNYLDCAFENNQVSIANCSQAFRACIRETGFIAPAKSEECYLAESAWQNLKISLWFSAGVFLFTNLLFPAILKGSAKTITRISSYNKQDHPILAPLGRFLLYFTDSNGDGRVTAPELIAPQTIFAFGSVALPIYQWLIANDAQAKCNYRNSLAPEF